MKKQEVSDILDQLQQVSVAREELEKKERALQAKLSKLLLEDTPTSQDDTSPFTPGQDVYIRNLRGFRISERHPNFATVTDILSIPATGEVHRVNLRKLDGGTTWRHPKNLRPLSRIEQRQIEQLRREREATQA